MLIPSARNFHANPARRIAAADNAVGVWNSRLLSRILRAIIDLLPDRRRQLRLELLTRIIEVLDRLVPNAILSAKRATIRSSSVWTSIATRPHLSRLHSKSSPSTTTLLPGNDDPLFRQSAQRGKEYQTPCAPGDRIAWAFVEFGSGARGPHRTSSLAKMSGQTTRWRLNLHRLRWLTSSGLITGIALRRPDLDCRQDTPCTLPRYTLQQQKRLFHAHDVRQYVK